MATKGKRLELTEDGLKAMIAEAQQLAEEHGKIKGTMAERLRVARAKADESPYEIEAGDLLFVERDETVMLQLTLTELERLVEEVKVTREDRVGEILKASKVDDEPIRTAYEHKVTQIRTVFDMLHGAGILDEVTEKDLPAPRLTASRTSSSSKSSSGAVTGQWSFYRIRPDSVTGNLKDKQYQSSDQNSVSSLAFYQTRNCGGSKKDGSMTSAELRAYLKTQGVSDPDASAWEVKLPNGTLIGCEARTSTQVEETSDVEG